MKYGLENCESLPFKSSIDFLNEHIVFDSSVSYLHIEVDGNSNV